nr:TetR/AcrR family transcriptional regulator [Litorivivens lipolytica]
MEAAVELFGERGAKGVSVSQICQRAAVSRDTFYRCFADKDAVIYQLYQSSINDHVESVLKSWELDYSNRAWLEEVCNRTVDGILAQHKIARFLFVESADPESHAAEVINRAYDRAARRLQRWCRQNQQSVPSREYFVALLVATQWLVHNAINKGMAPREVTKAKEATVQLFYAALADQPISGGG